MTESGYTTSSEKVNELIKKNGLKQFEIIQMLSEDECGCDVLLYETDFLKNNRVASNPIWINMHENDFMSRRSSSEYSKMAWEELPRKKRIESQTEKYGTKIPIKSETVKNNYSKNYREKTGYNWPLENPAIVEKQKNTLMERHGVNNCQKIKEVQEKTRDTCSMRYGVTYAFNSDYAKARSKEEKNKLRNRPVVLALAELFDKKKIKRKEFGLSSNWKYYSEPTLNSVILKLQSIDLSGFACRQIKELTDRDIVKTIKLRLSENRLKTSDIGLPNCWQRMSDEKLKVALLRIDKRGI